MPLTTAPERAREAASRYLSNIVVIDDRMSMGDSGDTHGLNVDELSRAFAQVDFSCGVYKPTGQQDEADVIAKLILKSDAAVLDWSLSNGSSASGGEASQTRDQESVTAKPELCINAIRKVLEADHLHGKPLRLIIIYTAETITQTVVDDLRTALGGSDLRAVAAGEFGLENDSTKILFKGKAFVGTVPQPFAQGQFALPVDELPEYITKQYAGLAAGLMPPAVLHALSALREGAGELLGIFSSKHDPAMILHAMLIPNTDDAAPFLRELLLDELSRIVEGCKGFNDSFSLEIFTEWINKKPSYASHGAPQEAHTADKLITFLTSREEGEGLTDKQAKKLLAVLYGTADWWKTARGFCRTCTLKYDPWSNDRPIGKEFMPVLTLGTIIRNTTGDFLICIVPRCDAARVVDGQPFPFLTMKRSRLDKDFSLTVKSSIDGNMLLAAPNSVSWQKLSLIRFSPQGKEERIKAECHDGSVILRLKDVRCFIDADGTVYEWVGDLKPHLALKLATDLAPGLSRVGIDEFDWLRLKKKSN